MEWVGLEVCSMFLHVLVLYEYSQDFRALRLLHCREISFDVIVKNIGRTYCDVRNGNWWNK